VTFLWDLVKSMLIATAAGIGCIVLGLWLWGVG
jgi:hypothetical protein